MSIEEHGSRARSAAQNARFACGRNPKSVRRVRMVVVISRFIIFVRTVAVR